MSLLIIILQGDATTAASFIREILGSPIGSFTFILGIMLLSGWLIYFVTRHITKYRLEYEEHKGRVSVVEDRIDKRIDKVETKIDTINLDTSYIRGNIDVILNSRNAPALVKAKSPISLTE